MNSKALELRSYPWGESLDFTAPAGRLQFHILAALNFLKVKGDFAAAISIG